MANKNEFSALRSVRRATTSNNRLITATVSGSFHRHMHEIAQAVAELSALGVEVLSPSDPRIVDTFGDFLFVASDRVRSINLVEDRHLDAIRASDFLWLVTPDGYVGQSASMEIGFAIATGVTIFSLHRPSDLTLRQYVTKVSSLRTAVQAIRQSNDHRVAGPRGLLIDPNTNIETIHAILENVRSVLSGDSKQSHADVEATVRSAQDRIVSLLRSR